MSGSEPKLAQNPLDAFANGACLDLRLRFAMQLMCSETFSSLLWEAKSTERPGAAETVSYAPHGMAAIALDVASALFDVANERGLIDPFPESLDDATKAHAERMGEFHVAQQAGANRAVAANASPIATLAKRGLNG